MDIQHIVVIGAGTMGHGIAGQAARVGYTVTLVDVDNTRVIGGLDAIGRIYAKGVARQKMTEAEAEQGRSRLKGSTNLGAAVASADLVIEAVPEHMELKRSLFGQIDAAAPDHAILASNTSSLPITEIASATTRAPRVLGMHFFNPVAVMPLLELVRGEFTDPAVMAAARAVGERLGKTCIEVADAPGFATSRINALIGNEAFRMLEQGVASAEDIDKAIKLGLNHPMGPFEMADLVGLDVRLSILEHLHATLGETFRPSNLMRRYVQAGRFGRKVGRGVYEYDAEGRRLPDEETP